MPARVTSAALFSVCHSRGYVSLTGSADDNNANASAGLHRAAYLSAYWGAQERTEPVSLLFTITTTCQSCSRRSPLLFNPFLPETAPSSLIDSALALSMTIEPIPPNRQVWDAFRALPSHSRLKRGPIEVFGYLIADHRHG